MWQGDLFVSLIPCLGSRRGNEDCEGCLKAEIEISIHLPCTRLMFETQNHNSMKTQVFLGNWSLWLQIAPYAQHTCTLEVFVDVLLQEQ